MRCCAFAGVQFNFNIGFGADERHNNASSYNPHANLPINALEFPLKHPPHVGRDHRFDRQFFDSIFPPNEKKEF